jgi:hypothetical protein
MKIDTIRDNGNTPFEWLTNFASLQHLVIPSRIVFEPSQVLPFEEQRGDDKEQLLALQNCDLKLIKLNALHVGCGTSTVGESLSLLHERVVKDASKCLSETKLMYKMHYGHVVNVDIDTDALQSMQSRWAQLQRRNSHNKINGEMDWGFIDFTKESTCRDALDVFYRTSNVVDGGYFDLVLDKSTFDCLLCAESDAVTGLLCEVYRALRIPSKITNDVDSDELIWGGVYILITFHPVEFVRDMLTQLPNAEWVVEHEVITREVENVGDTSAEDFVCNTNIEEIITRYDKAANCIVSTGVKTKSISTDEINQGKTSAWSSGKFCPDENYKRSISVFACRRICTTAPNCILDRDAVRKHVEQCCNEWFKTTNPMVTVERENEISLAFASASTDNSGAIDLRQCYDILFTDSEKEHLTYEYFLEDWDAYCEMHCITAQTCMTLKVALDFLTEMQ